MIVVYGSGCVLVAAKKTRYWCDHHWTMSYCGHFGCCWTMNYCGHFGYYWKMNYCGHFGCYWTAMNCGYCDLTDLTMSHCDLKMMMTGFADGFRGILIGVKPFGFQKQASCINRKAL
jgi:hypothetical protein